MAGMIFGLIVYFLNSDNNTEIKNGMVKMIFCVEIKHTKKITDNQLYLYFLKLLINFSFIQFIFFKANINKKSGISTPGFI
jgi:hypothetical protein